VVSGLELAIETLNPNQLERLLNLPPILKGAPVQQLLNGFPNFIGWAHLPASPTALHGILATCNRASQPDGQGRRDREVALTAIQI